MKIKELLIRNLNDKNFFYEIQKLKSPAYIYNLGITETLITSIKNEIKERNNIKLYFAVKANSNIEVLKFLKSRVDGFDVASMSEVQLLDSLSIDNYNINGPGFTFEDIQNIYLRGKYLDFNSFSQLQSVIKLDINENIGIRVNIPYFENNTFKESRFGIDIFDENFIDFMKKNHLLIRNLHFHNGKKDEGFFNILRNILLKIDTSLISKECSINLGGGIERYIITDSLKDLLNEIDKLNAICSDRGINTTFILEPGNALVNLSGYMLSTVISSDYNKNNEKLQIVLDSSAYNLHTWYKPRIVSSTSKKTKKMNIDIFGLTCYEDDAFFNNINFNELVIGDKLILNPVGAYSSSNHRNLHNIPFPAEYSYYKNKIWK